MYVYIKQLGIVCLLCWLGLSCTLQRTEHPALRHLNIKLHHGLKSIGQRAFSGCGRLCGTLVLPSGVTAIEYGAFMGCDNLRHVLATGNKITTLGDNLFGNDKDKLIYRD